MTPFEWVAVAFLALMTVGMWVSVPSYWTGRNAHLQSEAYRGLIVFTPLAQRAIYRAHLVGVVTLSVFAVGTLMLVVVHNVDSAPTWLAYLTLMMCFGGLILAFGGMLSVAVFNRPKKLVAPHLRHQPGLLILWRRAHRIRRSMGDRSKSA